MASKSNILNKASNRLRKLIQEDIRKKGLIKTGDLIRSIDASFKEKSGEINIQIGAIYYYTFLDDGTRYIKSFNITEDVINGKQFQDLLEETISDITEIKIDDIFKGLGNKGITIK